LASPVERCRHLEALAGGLKSIYMLHAGEDLVVQFVSWVPGAFESMEAELLEYAEEHLLRSSKNVSAKHMAHQASVDITRDLIRLRQSPTTPQSPYDLHGMDDMWPADSMVRLGHFSTSAQSQCETDDSWPADSVSTESSTPSSGLLSLAASMLEVMTSKDLKCRSAQRSKDAAIADISAIPLDQRSQIVPAVLLETPAGNLPEPAPAILEAVPPQRIPAVLPGVLKLLPPDVVPDVPDVVGTVVAAPRADEPRELATAIFLAVPPKPIANMLPGALKPRKVAFEEFDSGWGTLQSKLQMDGMNSAVCSGEWTAERMDPFQPEDSAQGTAPCQPYAPTPRAEEAQHRIDAILPDTAFAAKPATVERWSQQEAEVVDDDDPAELVERARQHFKRSILADASEQNLSGSSGSPTPSAVMTGGCTPPARWELKSKPSTVERWLSQQAEFSESGDDDMSQASHVLCCAACSE
jgi:hypothetical protein